MNTSRWALLTLRRGVVVRPLAFGIVVVLTCIAYLCLTVSASVSRAVMDDYVVRGTLGQVEISPPTDGAETRQLTKAATDGLARVAGVSGVAVKYTASLPWTNRAAILAGTTWSPIDKVELVAGRAVRAPGEIVLPERVQGTSTASTLGTSITIDSVKRVAEGQGRTTPEPFTVVGLYSLDRAPERPDTAYLHASDALRLAAAREGLTPEDFERIRGADSVVIQTGSTETARDVAQRLRAERFDARAIADRVADVSGAPALVRLAGWLLAMLASLVVAGTAAARASEAGTRRLREFALLRGLGWTLRDLTTLVVVESALVTLSSVVLGLGLMLPVTWVAVGPLLSTLGLSGAGHVPAVTLLGVTGGLVVVACAVALFAARRALTDDPYLVARSQV